MSIKITSGMTDDAIVREIGARFKAERLRQRTQQQEIEEQQKLSRSAIKSLENGKGNPTLKSLIAALRGLGKLEELDKLISNRDDKAVEGQHAMQTQEQIQPSPMQLLVRAKQQSLRVRKPKSAIEVAPELKNKVNW